MDFPKSVAGVGLVDGKFVDEDQVTGTPGSLIPASWGNAVTQELIAIIEAAGLTPSENNNAQAAAALLALLGKKLDLAGGQMTGALRAKGGAGGAGNPNNCGVVFDDDTGLFSPGNGQIELHSNGETLLKKHSSGAIQAAKGVRAPKGAPSSADVSGTSGYAFEDDGDTGLFAEGGTSVSGSDLVFRIDNTAAGRIKAVMRSGAGANGWGRLLNGQIIQWGEIVVTPTAGTAKSWSFTLPTTFAVGCFQAVAIQGNGNGPGMVQITVEALAAGSVTGYLYCEDSGDRKLRIFAIGE